MRRTALIACVSAVTATCMTRWMDRHGWPAWWFILSVLAVAVVLMWFEVKKLDDDDS